MARPVRLGRLRPDRLLASALAPACTHVARSARPRPRPGEAAPPTSYYDAGGAVPSAFSVERVAEDAGTCTDRILLPPRLVDGLERVPLARDPIEILHVQPRAGTSARAPLIVMSPILGNSLLLVGSFARTFARHGWSAAIVQRKELAFHPEASVAQAEEEVRLVVMRSRQAHDWLRTRESVDASRCGTFGISAGAIVSSMLAGADDRLGPHLWMLSGGPLTDVMVDTVEERFRGYARAVLARTRQSRDTIRRLLRQRIRTDPLRLAARVDPEKVLLVLARFDRSVPYRYGLAHWRALGRPERVVCPFGHYTTFMLLPWLRRRAVEFFARHFAERG